MLASEILDVWTLMLSQLTLFDVALRVLVSFMWDDNLLANAAISHSTANKCSMEGDKEKRGQYAVTCLVASQLYAVACRETKSSLTSFSITKGKTLTFRT